MFPGPGTLALVTPETVQASHQQTTGPVRAQAQIGFVQAAGGRPQCQQADQLLGQTRVPARRFQRSWPVRDRLRISIVEKHQVEVGGETEFLAAQTAITQHRQTRAGGRPVLADDLPLGQVQHRGQNGLRECRQLPCRAAR